MRKYVDIINEAPMMDVNLYGDWSDTTSHSPPQREIGKDEIAGEKNSFVSRIDRAQVRDPEFKTKAIRAFRNCPVPIYCYIVNKPEMLHFLWNLDYGRLDLTTSLPIFPPN